MKKGFNAYFPPDKQKIEKVHYENMPSENQLKREYHRAYLKKIFDRNRNRKIDDHQESTNQ